MIQDTRNRPDSNIPPELASIARDLDRRGRWGEALDRARLALRDFYDRRRDRRIGHGLKDEMLALDLAKLVGADVVGTRQAFRRTAESVWDVILAEFRDMLEAPKASSITMTTGGRKRA